MSEQTRVGRFGGHHGSRSPLDSDQKVSRTHRVAFHDTATDSFRVEDVETDPSTGAEAAPVIRRALRDRGYAPDIVEVWPVVALDLPH